MHKDHLGNILFSKKLCDNRLPLMIFITQLKSIFLEEAM